MPQSVFFNSVNFAISMRFTNYFAQAAFLHKVLILEIDFEKRALPPEYQSIFFSARSSVSSYIVRPLRFCNLNLKKYFCTFRIIKANISVLSFSPQGSDSPCVNPYLYFRAWVWSSSTSLVATYRTINTTPRLILNLGANPYFLPVWAIQLSLFLCLNNL